MTASVSSRFLRDPALPFIEARLVADGNALSHAPHSHDCHSFGAITSGRSHYWNRGKAREVSRGDIVVINPEDRHACNAQQGRPWGYHMLYVDSQWLAERCPPAAGAAYQDVPMFSALTSRNPRLHQAIMAMSHALADDDGSRLERDSQAELLAEHLTRSLRTRPHSQTAPTRLARALELLEEKWASDLRLSELCSAAECSATSLIAAFRQHHGLTPHAALIDLRVRHARRRLRDGEPIAGVAQACGFADQAHLQRTFKRLLATTPGHYLGRR
ncbi:AraC family transcriptional regulator [Halomonas sp. V046]|uniref:AraC family transcriptional regulator n=1 Tax=Halomonas sp. V046 TaxID=3459611 RepID=UPI0040444F52